MERSGSKWDADPPRGCSIPTEVRGGHSPAPKAPAQGPVGQHSPRGVFSPTIPRRSGRDQSSAEPSCLLQGAEEHVLGMGSKQTSKPACETPDVVSPITFGHCRACCSGSVGAVGVGVVWVLLVLHRVQAAGVLPPPPAPEARGQFMGSRLLLVGSRDASLVLHFLSCQTPLPSSATLWLQGCWSGFVLFHLMS